MFKKTYHATHPDMMQGADNDALRDRYLLTDLFKPGEINLNYLHNERFVIGGVIPTTAPVDLPNQTEPASGMTGRCCGSTISNVRVGRSQTAKGATFSATTTGEPLCVCEAIQRMAASVGATRRSSRSAGSVHTA